MPHVILRTLILALGLFLVASSSLAGASAPARMSKAEALRAWLAENMLVSQEVAPVVSDVEIEVMRSLVRVTEFNEGVCDPRETRLCLNNRPVHARMDIQRVRRNLGLFTYYQAREGRFELSGVWLRGVSSSFSADLHALLSDDGSTWYVRAQTCADTTRRRGPKALGKAPALSDFVDTFGARSLERVVHVMAAKRWEAMREEGANPFESGDAEFGKGGRSPSMGELRATAQAHDKASKGVKRVLDVLTAAITPGSEGPSQAEMDEAQKTMVEGTQEVADNGKERAFGFAGWLLKLLSKKNKAERSECFEEASIEEIKESLGY